MVGLSGSPACLPGLREHLSPVILKMTNNMNKLTDGVRWILLGAWLVFPCFAWAQKPSPAGNDVSETETRTEGVNREYQPFLASAQTFVDAYTKRDASAIGNMFTADAEFLDEFGEMTQGRDAIVALFENVFESSLNATIDEIAIERIRKITDRVVMEEGTVFSTESPGKAQLQSRYVALHTLEKDGKWRINSLKNMPASAAKRKEQLEQLNWMIGDWVNENDDSVVAICKDCRGNGDNGHTILTKNSLTGNTIQHK